MSSIVSISLYMFHMSGDALALRAEPMAYHSSGVDDIMVLISQNMSSV